MGPRDLGYRRFFDIKLAGRSQVRKRAGVLRDSPIGDALGLRAAFVGLRVDHPDGLRDPLEYFQRLRAACPDTWIVAEKILLGSESLRESWPVRRHHRVRFSKHGGPAVRRSAGAQPLTDFYREFTGSRLIIRRWSRAQTIPMRDTLASEIITLTAMLLDCARLTPSPHYTRHEAHEVIRATMACMPVYRTTFASRAKVLLKMTINLRGDRGRQGLSLRPRRAIVRLPARNPRAPDRRKVGRRARSSISADFRPQ